jgi:hypothetical protein
MRIVDQSTHNCGSEWTLKLVLSSTDLFLIINCLFGNKQYIRKSKYLENTTISQNADNIEFL